VLFPKDAETISKIVKVARQNDVEFVICCGRHSTGAASSTDKGIVIDLSKMRKVTVDTENKTIALEGGATWYEVDTEAAKYGLATVGGM
jgi:FAD/FMN-containing dehydrogenase